MLFKRSALALPDATSAVKSDTVQRLCLVKCTFRGYVPWLWEVEIHLPASPQQKVCFAFLSQSRCGGVHKEVVLIDSKLLGEVETVTWPLKRALARSSAPSQQFGGAQCEFASILTEAPSLARTVDFAFHFFGVGGWGVRVPLFF